MLFGLLNFIISNMSFMGSYSNEVFPPPLSLEEENDCIIKMKNGDTDARNKLILHNLRLVAHIVKKFDTNGDDVDDLIGIGTVGLIKGIDTYSLDKKVKLTTYAAKCAENEILMYFRSNKKYLNNISLNEIIAYDKDGDEVTLEDVIEENPTNFEENLDLKDNIKRISKYLNVLNKRELNIIKKRYGLNNEKEETQKEIAKKLNISRSYVSRIEKRALIKMLREFIKNKNI